MNLVSTWGEGMTRHFTLLWLGVGTLSTVAVVKLKDLKLFRASAKALSTFYFSMFMVNFQLIYGDLLMMIVKYVL